MHSMRAVDVGVDRDDRGEDRAVDDARRRRGEPSASRRSRSRSRSRRRRTDYDDAEDYMTRKDDAGADDDVRRRRRSRDDEDDDGDRRRRRRHASHRRSRSRSRSRSRDWSRRDRRRSRSRSRGHHRRRSSRSRSRDRVRRRRRSSSASGERRERRRERDGSGGRRERRERGSRWDKGEPAKATNATGATNAGSEERLGASDATRDTPWVVRVEDVKATALNKQIEMMRALSSTAKEEASKAIEAARAKAAELMEAPPPVVSTVSASAREIRDVPPPLSSSKAQAVETAETAVRQSDGSDGESAKKVTYLTEFYPIDVKHEGLIIGPSGVTIRKLQAEIGTDIQVVRGEGKLQIKGSREKIDFAKASLDEFLRTKGPRTVRVNCKARSGLIIGNAGLTIKALKEQTNCRIEVMRDVEEVVITGPGDRVDAAKTLVEKIIADSWVEGGAEGGSVTIVEEVVPCAYKAGAIIGPGGATIRQLRETTGVSIDIERGANGCKAGDQCRIIGTPAQVKKAVELVHQLLDEMNQVNMQAAPAVPPMYAYGYGAPYDPNAAAATIAPQMDPATYAAWQQYYAQLGYDPNAATNAYAQQSYQYPPQP